MPEVTYPTHKDGDVLVNYEEKVFEDVKANPGEKALVTFHGVAHEGSIGLVNTLVATRLLRKGYETSILLYGPGVTMGFQKGFPTLGDEAFPGHLLVNKRLAQFMAEGGKIYACRFSTQALYGQTEKAFIPGIIRSIRWMCSTSISSMAALEPWSSIRGTSKSTLTHGDDPSSSGADRTRSDEC